MRIICLFAILVAAGCTKQDNEKIREMSQLEGNAQAQAQLEQDRGAAKVMENDLSERFDFYEANSGHFEGWLIDGGTKYKIRLALYPNLPRYTGTRQRSQQEVQADLTNLALNAQITQWNPNTPSASVGCRLEGLRPDLTTGELNIISASCPSSYFLVLNGTSIAGTAQPSNNPAIFDLQATRMPEKLK